METSPESPLPQEVRTHFVASLWASLMAQIVKNPPARQESWVRFLGRKDPLEEEMETRDRILA